MYSGTAGEQLVFNVLSFFFAFQQNKLNGSFVGVEASEGIL